MVKILRKVMLLMAAVVCWSCSQDAADDDLAVTADNDGRLHITYQIANTTGTRVTEDEGWNDAWGENTITRLDLFVVKSDGTLVHDEFTGDAIKSPLTTTNVTYKNVASATDCYLIANCDEVSGITTLDGLKAKMIANGVICNIVPTPFVMDAKTLPTVDTNNKTVKLHFKLRRTVAKIMVRVKDKDDNLITDKCAFNFVNYASEATSVLAESEKYAKSATTLATSADIEFTDKTNNTINDALLTYGTGTDAEKAVVFYSNPNSWFDESKVEGSTGAYKITNHQKEQPIIASRQTYIHLLAPYPKDSEERYYYKVPMNLSLFQYNDNGTYTDDELEDIKNYYRLQRNTIYNITVTIDRKGGLTYTPATPTFNVEINDWTQGGEWEIDPNS